MRVCIRKSDNRIIDSQSNDQASLDALHRNASARGYSTADVDIKVIPDTEFRQLLAAQSVPTAQELDAQNDDAVVAAFNNPGVTRALATLLFQITNDVRILKGQQAITVAQFKNTLKAQIRGST